MHKNMHYKNLIIDIFAVTFRKEGVDWNQRYADGESVAEVTFRKEGVDWNMAWIRNYININAVTFRKEGVDWNLIGGGEYGRVYVTFRKEGVDWNVILPNRPPRHFWSPSVRKVWIEIKCLAGNFPNH